MGKGKYHRKQKYRHNQTQENTAKTLFLNKEMNPESETENRTKGQREASSNDDRRMRLRKVLKRSSVTDWLLTIFTFALAVLAFVQFYIIQGQLDVMRKDERAWMIVRGEPHHIDLAVGKAPSTKITILNTGKTIARAITATFYIEIVPNDGSLPHYDGSIVGARLLMGTIVPNYPRTIPLTRGHFKSGSQVETEAWPLTTDENTSLIRGETWLALYGNIQYWDVFGTAHWFRYCDWVTFGPTGMGYKAATCAEYNNTDNN